MEDLKISLVQADLKWEDKSANLAMLSEKLAALKDGTDIIILPEMFSTGFSMNAKVLAEDMTGQTIQWLLEKARALQCIITGSIIINENGKYYNRLIWAKPDGNLQYYNKRHLFSMAAEEKTYSPGDEKLIVECKGWKICPMICYDLRFPVWIRNIENYDLLIFVANWPERRAIHWQKLLPARAIENQCYTVGVNRVGADGNGFEYNGYSMAINPMGEALVEMIVVEEVATLSLRYEEITKIRRYMPFLADRDNFKLQV